MQAASEVVLPDYVVGPFEVFVNGIPKRPGVDFEQRGRTLVFQEALAGEGRLGFWRWASIAIGVAGTYRKNDTVDIVYTRDGRRTVATLSPTVSGAPSD